MSKNESVLNDKKMRDMRSAESVYLNEKRKKEDIEEKRKEIIGIKQRMEAEKNGKRRGMK